MDNQKTVPATTLMPLEEASQTSGVRADVIEHLLILHIIKPAATDPGSGPLFSVDQAMLLEILAGMDVLIFRIEQMRDMVRAVDTLSAFPHSILADRYRIRLGAFIRSLSRRTVANDTQFHARARIIELLKGRYTWLAA